jgi:short-subunit dehydrogenase
LGNRPGVFILKNQLFFNLPVPYFYLTQLFCQTNGRFSYSNYYSSSLKIRIINPKSKITAHGLNCDAMRCVSIYKGSYSKFHYGIPYLKSQHNTVYLVLKRKDDMDFSDKVMVITGASSGIGRSVALEFSKLGGKLVLAARREEVLKEVAIECGQNGGKAVVVRADVTQEKEVNQIKEKAVEAFGKIDVWLNNAGVAAMGRLDEVPYEAMKKVIDTNVMGYIYGIRAVVPLFKKQVYGTIINISSMVGAIGQPFSAIYAASKFAVRGLSFSLEQELADYDHIHVCCVMPSVVETPAFKHSMNYSGMAIDLPGLFISPQKVAHTIIKLIEHPKKEVTVGALGWFSRVAKRVSPGIFDQSYRYLLLKMLFKKGKGKPKKGYVSDQSQKINKWAMGFRKGLFAANWITLAGSITLFSGLAFWLWRRERRI